MHIDIQPLLHDAFGDRIITYRYDTNFSDPYYWLTIHASEATKANGIRALIQTQNFDNGPETVFGDNLNDLPMFARADRAIEVANAHPQVLDVADLIIDSNEADSVIRFIANETPNLLP